MKFLESALAYKNQFWRYGLLSALVMLLGQFLGAIPLLCVAWTKGVGVEVIYDFESYGLNKTLGLLLMLIPFILSLLFFHLFFRNIHGSATIKVYNGRRKLRWKRVFVGFVVWIVIIGIDFVIGLIRHRELFNFQLDWGNWIPLILVSLLFIPLQTTLEEVFFRGYLAQGIGVLTRNRIVAILIPSILFGLMHGANPEVAEYGFWKTMPVYILMGIGLGVAAVVDDGIELSLGVHAANNIFLSIFLTNESSVFRTDALFQITEIDMDGQILITGIFMLIMLIAFWFIYKWDWSVLVQRIQSEKRVDENTADVT